VGAEGRYRLIRCLGGGGMGEVHLAVARGAAGFEKLVAIKLIDTRHGADAAINRSLVREAFLGVHLDHESLVSVLDFGEEDGRNFLVMEYVRGFTLSHVLTFMDSIGQNLPLHAALHIVRSTLDALDYLHGVTGTEGKPLGLVHGDVSASNVLLAGDGRVKLSDLGIASVAGDVIEPGRVAGKLPYLPPEAFAGAARTASWDVYAAAAMLYEAIAGVPAFPGTSVEAVRKALRRGAPSLAAHRPDVPAALAATVERALSFHPERRPRTVAELRAALDAAAPPRLEDAAGYRALIATIYGDPRFVQQHGQLPTSDGYTPGTGPAGNDSTDLAVAVPTVGRVRTRALRFGVSPAMGAAKAREAGERFTAYLTRALEREVRPVVLADYAMLIACVVDGEVDLAWMPPTVTTRSPRLRVFSISRRWRCCVR